MIRSLRPSLVVLALCAGFGLSARADAPDVPKLPTPLKPSMEGFLAADPTCREWTNGCQVCTAGETGGAAACSTAGIACTPGRIVCQRRK